MSHLQRLRNLLIHLSYEEKEVTLSSGRRSNFYFDGKQTSLSPEGAYLLGELLFDVIQKKLPFVEAVGGPTLGADPLVTAVSLTSYLKSKPIPAFIIRKEPKSHGTEAWIEGGKNIKFGTKVAILEDVVTTGASSLKAIEKAISCGFDVQGVVAIVDREEGGREAIEDAGYCFESLFTKTDLLSKL